MKKTYHLCLSAGNEIMFRDLEDYNRGFNSFALALYKTGSTGLVESFMSNHVHLLVQTADPEGLMYALRQSTACTLITSIGVEEGLLKNDILHWKRLAIITW